MKEFMKEEKADRENLCRNLLGIDHFEKFLRIFETAKYKTYLDLSKIQPHLLTCFQEAVAWGSICWERVFRTATRKDSGEEEEPPVNLFTKCLGVVSHKVCFEQEICRSGEAALLKPSQLLDFIKFLELKGEL